MAKTGRKNKKTGARTGKLRIADHWNAISIIASSQANPLKAVAEFVENRSAASFATFADCSARNWFSTTSQGFRRTISSNA